MILGEGNTKIQLCNESGVEQYSHTLSDVEQRGLTQLKNPREYDTKGIEVMDNGDRKTIISGITVDITIPVQVVENVTSSAWETFLYRLWDWTQKIKVTPWIDESSYTYWCILEQGRMSERPQEARNLVEIDTLKFVGAERVSSVS